MSVVVGLGVLGDGDERTQLGCTGGRYTGMLSLDVYRCSIELPEERYRQATEFLRRRAAMLTKLSRESTIVAVAVAVADNAHVHEPVTRVAE